MDTISKNCTAKILRQIIREYRVGDILQVDKPELYSYLVQHKKLSNELRFFVFGPSNAGKSHFLMSVPTSYEGTNVQYYRFKGGADSSVATATTKRATDCTLMINDSTGTCTLKLIFVDSRGLVGHYGEETRKYLCGELPVGSAEKAARSQTVLPEIFQRSHCGVSVIAANETPTEVEKLKELHSKIADDLFPVLQIVTKRDLVKDSSFSKQLNIHPDDICEISSYNPATNNQANEETDKSILLVILKLIRKAEYEGFEAEKKNFVQQMLDTAVVEGKQKFLFATEHVSQNYGCTTLIIIILAVIILSQFLLLLSAFK